MNKQHLYGLINPFERIAGLEALLWGLAGMVVSTALSFYSGLLASRPRMAGFRPEIRAIGSAAADSA